MIRGDRFFLLKESVFYLMSAAPKHRLQPCPPPPSLYLYQSSSSGLCLSFSFFLSLLLIFLSFEKVKVFFVRGAQRGWDREREKESDNRLFYNILQLKVSQTIIRKCIDWVLARICHLTLKDCSKTSHLLPLISFMAGDSQLGLSKNPGLPAFAGRDQDAQVPGGEGEEGGFVKKSQNLSLTSEP